jgi:carbon monoxide dehydrogenase subunit G
VHYEVVVPVPVRLVWGAFHDAERLAACLPVSPGDATGAPAPAGVEFTGRLRLRAGGTTITYRGRVGVAEDELPLALVVVAEGAEARGGAEIKVTMTVRLDDEGRNTRLVLDAALTAAGRTRELPAGALRAAAERLADRFAENLTRQLAPAREPEIRVAAPVAADQAPPPVLATPDPLPDPVAAPLETRAVLRRVAPAGGGGAAGGGGPPARRLGRGCGRAAASRPSPRPAAASGRSCGRRCRRRRGRKGR